MSEFVLDFFEGKNLATIEKKKHSYLMIDGHDQADIYIKRWNSKNECYIK